MIDKEVWIPIKDYEGFYEVSSLGRIKSLPRKGVRNERILRLSVNSEGYLVGALYKNGLKREITAHQLVAESFLGHSSSGMRFIVNHIDHNKLNNRVENLEITDIRDNTSKGYMRKDTSSKYTGVYWHVKANKWMAYIYINGIREYLGLHKKEEDAHEAYKKRLFEFKNSIT